MRLPDWRDGDPMSYGFWKRAKPLSDSAFTKGFIMTLMNRERARLAKRIRELERKLGRPHRHLKQCGAVQYIMRDGR
jgi:hypothetical protein